MYLEIFINYYLILKDNFEQGAQRSPNQ